MNKITLVLILLSPGLMIRCNTEKKQSIETPIIETFSFEIENLNDQEYPDNPDIGYRSKNYQENLFEEGRIERTSDFFNWNFSFLTKDSDTICLNDIDVSELIPTIPKQIKSDEYLSYISCINQEWNRNQIRFKSDEFLTTEAKIIQVDLARNCLNAYLWEVILYIEEDGKTLAYSHGWFDFPHDLYARLFEGKNNIPFDNYKEPLENWLDPESKKVELNLLRNVVDSLEIDFHDFSDEMYPLKEAREKKYKEIIYPVTFSSMRDLQSDSTLFATFSPPGIYDKKDPRVTELGRIYNLKKVNLLQLGRRSNDNLLYEIQLTFSHKNNESETTLIIGGIDFEEFPVLNISEANKGWKNSMGIGNHPFYEPYKDHLGHPSRISPYYAMLLDENGKWLDSHRVGIDGPIFHFSDTKRKTLHLWLLSFERHALVGHYEIKLH